MFQKGPKHLKCLPLQVICFEFTSGLNLSNCYLVVQTGGHKPNMREQVRTVVWWGFLSLASSEKALPKIKMK